MGKGVHLKAVIIVEAQGIMADYAPVKLEPAFFKTFPAPWMAGIRIGILYRSASRLTAVKETEILLCVDILFSVSGEKDILLRLKGEPA